MEKKPGRKLIEVDVDELLELYESGLSLMQIANQLGVSETLVYRRLKDQPLYNARKTESQIDNKMLLDLYNSGLTTQQVADKLGIGRSTAIKHLQRNPEYKPRIQRFAKSINMATEERMEKINEQIEEMNSHSLTLMASIVEHCDLVQITDLLYEIALLPASYKKTIIDSMNHLSR